MSECRLGLKIFFLKNSKEHEAYVKSFLVSFTYMSQHAISTKV